VKIPGMKLVWKAKEVGNVVRVPMTRGLGLSDLLKRTFTEAWDDHLDAFAGSLTYKGLFALFPLSVFLLPLLGLFGAPDVLDYIFQRTSGVLPEGAGAFLEDQLLEITASKAKGAFTVGAIVSPLLALWGVSGAFRSVIGCDERHVRGQGGTPGLETVLALCASLFRDRFITPLRVRAHPLRPSAGGRTRRHCGLGLYLPSCVERRAVADPLLRRPLSLLPRLLLRSRRRAALPVS
jgi:hypothetical protein